eukprot:scaffold11132_cov54-Phaeocystis_antarctica.AAC.3
MCEPCTPDALLEAVRGLRIADPDLGPKPLLAKLRAQQPDLGAGTREVREALNALKAESEAAKFATATPAADNGGAPSNVALSLACFGCARLPSDMDDDREKHPVCPKCVKRKLPTTYWCCVACPGNPGAWKLHAVYHKEEKRVRKMMEDGGAAQQRARELAVQQARLAEQTGDKYTELLAEGIRYDSKEDYRRAARTYREAIVLRPDRPAAYHNLGAALHDSGHHVEAAQRFLEAKERYPVGSAHWAEASAAVFNMIIKKECREAAKPEWWNDEGLKALSARVMRAAPNEEGAQIMRAVVLSGSCDGAWEAGPRSSVELKEAAAHYERAVALTNAPAVKAERAAHADWCRSHAATMWT